MSVVTIVVLYDGSCPTCVKDRQHYEKLSNVNNSTISWCDYNLHPNLLETFNISARSAMTELHLMVNNQQVVKSIDAYALLLNHISYLKPIAWFIKLPFIFKPLERYYLYRVNKRLKNTGRL